jgi:hypothetical protein
MSMKTRTYGRVTDTTAYFPPAGSLRLESIVLVGCDLSRGEGDPDRPGAVETRGDIQPSEPAQGRVAYVVGISCRLQDAEGAQVLELDAAFNVAYELAKGFDPTAEQLEAFAWGAVVFQAHPYLREFIASMTVRGGLAPLLLPLLERDDDDPLRAATD